MKKTRFGAEIFLNNLFEKETKKIPLKNLAGLLKYEKRNSSKAFKEYLNEAVEIAQEIGRREGLLPEDYQTIAKIAKVVNFKELKSKVEEIKNKKVKRYFKKYIIKYINLAKKKIKDFSF